MEFGTIDREIYIEARPETVFDVISRPERIQEWWPDEAHYDLVPGASGEIVFGARGTGETVESFTVVEVSPPSRFSFRWMHPSTDTAAEGNSLLVTFDLVAAGDGTVLTMTETGFREMGWEVAVLEQQYRDHISGWDFYLPRIAPVATGTQP